MSQPHASFKLVSFLVLILSTAGIAFSQTEGPSDLDGPPFVHSVAIQPSDSPESLIAKAANVVPSRAQRLHHQDEFVGFIHFGPNTFTGVEWGNGIENPNVFDPGESMDTDQWCEAMQSAGMKKVIITAKHHDGFCLWQTRYNDQFSVRATKWRKGQGDVLRNLSDSCRKAGIKLAVYLSPADLHQMESAEGLYGNESRYQPSIIPTDPDSLQSSPRTVRRDLPENSRTFELELDDYNRYFMNQLYELLTDYGPIHEVWFDGAHPKRKGGQTYRKDDWFRMIRDLAPDAAIFGGPDVRWCGNEGGRTRAAEWSVLPVQDLLTCGEDRPGESPGGDEAVTSPSYDVYGKKYDSKRLQFIVCETNTSIRSGWFWRNDDEQSVRTPDDVFDIYERATGGNSTFLLNIPPDNRGLFGERDRQCLIEVGRRIRETYGVNLAADAIAENDSLGSILCDGDHATFWQPKENNGSLVVVLPRKERINRFVVQEAISKVGQRIKAVALDGFVDGEWQELAKEQTVGHKRIFRFSVVETGKLRIRVLDSRLPPTIAEVSAHLYRQPPPPISIARNGVGKVAMTAAGPSGSFSWNRHQRVIPNENPTAEIRYTLDGSPPTKQSSLFKDPFEMPSGGRVMARSFVDGASGPVADVRLGLSKLNWKVHHVSGAIDGEHSADKSMDGDPQSYWLCKPAGDVNESIEIAIDLGEEATVEGVAYLPRQDGESKGMVVSGRVEASRDGKNWELLATINFGNLKNDPTVRTLLSKKPILARYVRLICEADVEGEQSASAAEIDVFGTYKTK